MTKITQNLTFWFWGSKRREVLFHFLCSKKRTLHTVSELQLFETIISNSVTNHWIVFKNPHCSLWELLKEFCFFFLVLHITISNKPANIIPHFFHTNTPFDLIKFQLELIELAKAHINSPHKTDRSLLRPQLSSVYSLNHAYIIAEFYICIVNVGIPALFMENMPIWRSYTFVFLKSDLLIYGVRYGISTAIERIQIGKRFRPICFLFIHIHTRKVTEFMDITSLKSQDYLQMFPMNEN